VFRNNLRRADANFSTACGHKFPDDLLQVLHLLLHSSRGRGFRSTGDTKSHAFARRRGAASGQKYARWGEEKMRRDGVLARLGLWA
jgi:hypothetical protein